MVKLNSTKLIPTRKYIETTNKKGFAQS